MATEYPDAFKKYIAALARHCAIETYHREYSLSLAFYDEESEETDESHSVKADIAVDSVYLRAVIGIYPSLLKDWEAGEYESIGGVMLHEICHIFTEPLYKIMRADMAPSQSGYFSDIVERQTERVKNTIESLLPDGWYLPENILKGDEEKSA